MTWVVERDTAAALAVDLLRLRAARHGLVITDEPSDDDARAFGLNLTGIRANLAEGDSDNARRWIDALAVHVDRERRWLAEEQGALTDREVRA